MRERERERRCSGSCAFSFASLMSLRAVAGCGGFGFLGFVMAKRFGFRWVAALRMEVAV